MEPYIEIKGFKISDEAVSDLRRNYGLDIISIIESGDLRDIEFIDTVNGFRYILAFSHHRFSLIRNKI